jgi:parallel beta-helix repeat protein
VAAAAWLICASAWADLTGPVAHWNLDESSGNVANDSAGGYNGIVHGAEWADGLFDGGLSFDGVDDYVDPGNIIAGWARGSISLWAKFNSTGPAEHGTVRYGVGGPALTGRSETAQLYLGTEGENRPFRFTIYGRGDASSDVTPDLGDWYHVVATWGMNGIRLYVNGALAGSHPYTGTIPASTHNKIGCSSWPDSAFAGMLDDVRIYDRPLSAGQVDELYGEAPPTGKTYHVDKINGSNSNDGLTPETAFATIQKGIDAVEDGDTVLVWPGVYFERISFDGKAITVRNADYPAVIESPGLDAVSFVVGEGPSSVLQNFVIRNSLIAIACNNESRPTLKNLTIVNNDFGIAAYESSNPRIRNCVLWNNADGDLYGCQAKFSLVEQDFIEPPSGGPLFADLDGGDYHPLSEKGRYVPAYGLWSFDEQTSPCVDGGDPNDDPWGERMPHGGRINMGAYGGTMYASMSEWPLTGDYDHNGRVGFKDFAAFCDGWLLELHWAAPPGSSRDDRMPPMPHRAAWEIEPYALSGNSIAMEATAATDEHGVEYLFENVVLAGHSSGWQDSPEWTDTGLSSSTEYCYRVRTRDKSPNANQGLWSNTACATTESGR